MTRRWVQVLSLTVGIALMLPISHAQATSSITFDRPVHFMTAEGTDHTVTPGTYRLEAVEQDRLRLMPDDGGGEVVLHAIGTTHDKQIDGPVSITLPDEQQPDVLHLALLLPGGKALDAIGTYSGVMPRGVTPLTGIQLATVAQLQLPPTPLFSLIPTHGPSGTPVRIEICGLPSTDNQKNGTISVGGKPVRQMVVSQSCGLLSNGLVFITEPLVLDMQGPPGPVPVRVEVPGSSRPAETVNFTIDPGSLITWNPRFQIVLGGSAVLDKETLLVWERLIGAHPVGTQDRAVSRCREAQIGGRLGWRLPTAAEFGMLLDPQAGDNPSLPIGHPFVSLNNYPIMWTSDRSIRRDPTSDAHKEFTEGVSAAFRLLQIDRRYFRNELLDRMAFPPGIDYKFSFSDPSRGAWCVRGPGGIPSQ